MIMKTRNKKLGKKLFSFKTLDLMFEDVMFLSFDQFVVGCKYKFSREFRLGSLLSNLFYLCGNVV